MRLVFAGTPQTAVPSLDALLASRHTVAAVLTRPDAPAGRGRRVAASAVAQRAREAGIQGVAPKRPADPAFGAGLLVATLDGIESGELEPRPQPHDGVSYAPKLDRADARVNWKLPAQAIDRLIRACTPAPGAWTTLNGATLKLGPISLAGVAAADRTDLLPGEVRVVGQAVLAGTGTTPVRLGDVQAEGKRTMPAEDWARGVRGADLVLD